MNVPFFSLGRQWAQLKSEIQPAIDSILETQYYIGGPTVTSFEEKFARSVGSSHGIGCNSGTDALWIALKALDVQPGDLVLTTPFSFIASSSEIVAHGAIPVFIDVERDSYLIDPIKIEQWLVTHAEVKEGVTLHKQTGAIVRGILPVNLFGQCANFTELDRIARAWHLWTIEDAAQSIGAYHKKRPSGALGTIATFSFYPTKNLSAFGDGGIMTTSDEKLATRLLQLRNHGRLSHYEYAELGINSRLDALQAAILNVKLNHIEALNERRREIADKYLNTLSEVSFVTLPKIEEGTHVYHQFSFTVPADLRQGLQDHLEKNGVQSRVYYPESLDTISFLTPDNRFATECPISHELTQTILSLPIWPELTDEQIDHVCAVMQTFGTQQAQTTTHTQPTV